MKTFSQTQPVKQELETDRFEIREGDSFIICDIMITDSKNYEHIGKINAIDIKTKEKIKKRTTSKSLVDQMANMIKSVGVDANGTLAEQIRVGVRKEQSKTSKHSYLTFYDV
jgi:hypothetical protein